MLLRFSLNYRAEYGQVLVVCGSAPALGAWNVLVSPSMAVVAGDDQWELAVELTDADLTDLTYKYALRDERTGNVIWEWGADRTTGLPAATYAEATLTDAWRPLAEPDNVLFAAAFTKALMGRAPGAPVTPRKKTRVGAASRKGAAASAATGSAPSKLLLRINAPRVPAPLVLAVSGADPALGGWDESLAVVLDGTTYPRWQAPELTLAGGTAYKYGLYDTTTRRFVGWETGPNRYLPRLTQPDLTVRTDEYFRHPGGPWRGAGVAVPVFSLRSRKGTGVGEFTDLQLLVDWAAATGLKLVQVLPINDTVAIHTWADSYPYAAISVYALHPIYLNLQALGTLADPQAQAAVEAERERLNALPEVNYEDVMELKARVIKDMYDQDRAAFLADPAFQAFFDEQQAWLVPYAAFSALRDRFRTADFQQWGEWATATDAQLAALTSPTGTNDLGLTYDDFAVHYYQQFHLDQQLRAATNYARSKGVALKGDLPIGIFRHSVEAWRQPELFNMQAQAGAPPDDFSVSGQNWRFPTYNWSKMAEDGYAWWRSRLTHLSRYFDALRIDHILGFFRIWEIPDHSVEGLLGHFSPALPLHRDEIRRQLGWFDAKRMTEPYIRWHQLTDIFNTQADAVRQEFLDDYAYGQFSLKPHVRTQRQIEAVIEDKLRDEPDRAEHWTWIRSGLYRLVNEVLLLEAAFTNGEAFNPRITLEQTYSFRELDYETRRRLTDLYADYFYRRHEAFWQEQGAIKLPVMKNATEMLICGEDLGMVPACVPVVMKETGILGLNIQRMPSQTGIEFFHPADAAYMSVVSPSSHDMSTVRGWWEEDRAKTQRFYNQLLGHGGEAPFYCEPWVARDVVVQHLYSPAMWAIFPIQDLLAIDGNLRRLNPADEQINVPSNPTHYWRYRLHVPLEDLEDAEDFNRNLRKLVRESGRETGS